MDDLRIGPNGRDDAVTRALRALYAAPRDPAYWETLEARIMARIAQEADAWWSPFRGWVRSGLLTAALLLLVAGVALVRSREAEARHAYRSVVDTQTNFAQQIASETSGMPEREATLRYVMSP